MFSRKAARRLALVIACVAVAGVGFLLAGTLSGGHIKTTTTSSAPPTASDPVLAAGTPAAFSYLAAQRSNRCGLTPAELQSYPLAEHLQGSCCYPMDLSTYQWQAKALHRYASIPQIPSDPYNVPVSLARELLGYEHSIRLSASQQARYGEAMRVSRLHGPCCCHCWRWDAFRGMSMFLIAREGWKASRVALLVDDLEGCGGKDEPPRAPGRATAWRSLLSRAYRPTGSILGPWRTPRFSGWPQTWTPTPAMPGRAVRRCRCLLGCEHRHVVNDPVGLEV